MHRLKLLVLVVLLIFCSINAVTSSSALRNYGSPKCVSEGRIADPDNCGQYYDCVRGKNGDFFTNKQSCFGHAFDASLEACVPASLAKGCTLSSTNIFRSVPVDQPKLHTICKSNDNEFICMDCKTLIMCVERKPYIIPCESGNVCYNKEKFKGGVCYPDVPLECTCDKDDIFRKDYYDSSKFLSCDKKGADPVIQSCPEGLEFNELRRTCGTPIDTSCSEVGTFAFKSDCKQYHTCIKTTSGWFQRNFTCTSNTMYNEQTGQCEDPCDWYDGSFVCKEEGRFSNLRDCTSFFECIKDPSDSNKFIQIEHVCPEGYEWLPWINRYHCVAKGSTRGKCAPQIPNICEIPSGWCSSKTETALTPDSNVHRDVGPHGRPSNSPMRNYESPKCVSEGRIADPVNCGQYYDCVRSSSGDFIANKQSCFGYAFDATRSLCVSGREAKGCILDSTDVYRSATVDDPKLQKICKSHDNEFICMDCKTLIMCVDRKPHMIPCKSGNVCYNDKASFKGGVCYPDAPLECTCHNDDIFRQDYYNPSKFLSCDSKGADPVVQSCPAGLEYNEQRKQCGFPIDTSCSESGTFALKSDCTNYHTCIYTTTGWFQRNFTCTDKTMYNDNTGKCEDPCDWYDGNFICSEEGRFPNPLDCSTFFECIEDPLDSNKFLQKEHVCPEGYEWLPMVNRHHCVAKGSTKERCVPQKLNICEIPTEWCSGTAPPTPEEICNDAGGSMFSQHCLVFSSGPQSCDDAKTTCSNKGGTLASIVDIDAVNAHLHSNYGSDELFWIGATGSYVETFGEGDNAMHLYMIPLANGAHFAYQPCAGTRGYICEIDTSPPETLRGACPDGHFQVGSQCYSACPDGYFQVGSQCFFIPKGTSPPETPHGACPDGHFQVGSQCFFIPTEGFKTWYGAQELCMEQGGTLAEPVSIPEFHEALSKQTSDYGFWLGGSNRKQGGNWRWSSRATMVGNSDSWSPEATNMYDTSEKCLFLMRGVEKPLTARSCENEHHYFICEKN